VLGTPPAFVLSQDQTLHRDLEPATEAVGPSIGVEEPAIPGAVKLPFFADWHQNSQHY
jgi:hypothetical protein